MVERTIGAAADAMAGRVIAGEPDARWRQAAIDSRRVSGGELFFALAGEHVDGHDFAADAVARGAAGAVVARTPADPPKGGAWVHVGDTFEALHALTRAVRREVPRQLVAITGSAGKTTTKELLAAMLTRRFRTARSPGNLNNLFGFPLSLLAVPDDCEWMVAEMGMSTPGELGRVSLLGRPDAALLLNVRPVHLESFPDLRGIAEAKAEILAGLADDGLLVANADDPEVRRIAERHRRSGGRVLLFGVEADEAEVRSTSPEALTGGRIGCRFELTAGGETVPITLAIHGLYNAENCLAAAAAAHALGVPLVDIADAAAGFRGGSMRGVVHRLGGGVTLVDDSYNSNPDAARRALDSAALLPGRRHLAVLGDMLELGPGEDEFHRDVGAHAAALGFEPLAGVGGLSRQLVAGAAEHDASKGDTSATWLGDAEAAAAWAVDTVEDGDVVLVKGSRGVGLEAVVEALLVSRKEGVD